MQPGPSLLALLWVVSDVSQAIPIFNLLGGGGGGGSQRPKCRYVPQTAYFPTYDTVYKQQCSTSYENECTTEVLTYMWLTTSTLYHRQILLSQL